MIGPHNPSNTMFATGLARFAQIENNPRGTVDAVARRIGRADQAQSPLILQCSIGEGVPCPLIESAARNIEETTHDSRITLATMGLDERILHSDTLRSGPIAHRSSHVCSRSPPGVRESLGSPSLVHSLAEFLFNETQIVVQGGISLLD